jgi:hypothetical protein
MIIFFLGNRLEDGIEVEGNYDEVVLDFFEGCLNEEEALALFESNNSDKRRYDLKRIVKHTHYKRND